MNERVSKRVFFLNLAGSRSVSQFLDLSLCPSVCLTLTLSLSVCVCVCVCEFVLFRG